MSNIVPFHDLQGMARAVAASGLFGMKSQEQALALMLVAQAEGQHPATITQDYDIIQGKAARKTHSVLARFQQMGGQVEWHALTNEIADATFSHKAGGKLRMTWTIKQAREAGLTDKDNWKKYPRAMLRARCIAEGVRAVYPAALGGMMVSEEVQDTTHAEPQTVEARVTERPSYPAEDFEKNLPTWRGVIESGRKTAGEIITMVSTRGRLTEEQIKAIRDCEQVQDAEVIEPEQEAQEAEA